MKKVGNVQEYMKAEYQVLRDLASSYSALGFNELQEKTSVSSRTLAKHLKNLVPKNVQKEGEKYRITDAGRQLVANIKPDLGTWTKKGGSRQSCVETVEVYSIGPKHFCKGTVKVTSTRELLPKEREKLDKAITHAIRTFSSIVPEDSGNWRISIYSHINSKK
ncbi:MAG: hypothetical protein NWE90_08330 [Candidatus Bathyarchaeota archaeon]|nr:hypothetical protein [Candidatus Bathyarchaeota archaeon]